MIRSFLKGGIFYKTPQLHENASISKDSDIVNKWYVDTKVNNTQINTKQYVDSRVASIPIINDSSYVKISGDQTINGTKYFNYSPTVPNPTAGSHAANKAYVDSKTSSGGYTQSFGRSGWTKLPNGLIIQWGILFALGNTTYNPVTFPIQFPNACLSVSVTRAYLYMAEKNADSLAVDSMGPTNMNVINSGPNTKIYYIAIGH